MTRLEPDTKATIEAYVGQVVRWNSQINLVSRQETGDRLSRLTDQCVDGFESLASTMNTELISRPMVLYFDLGSGGGFPGIIWHCLLSSRSISHRTWLVEPREKRAWFLQRQASLPGIEPFEVIRGRWGESFARVTVQTSQDVAPPLFLVSLKALHLTDTEVLEGLVSFMADADMGDVEVPGARMVAIARYYPGGTLLADELCKKLHIGPAGEFCRAGAVDFVTQSSESIAVGAETCPSANLILSSYLF